MALHSRDAVTVSAAVATRSRTECSSMEGHASLSTALVHRAYAVWSREVNLRSCYTSIRISFPVSACSMRSIMAAKWQSNWNINTDYMDIVLST